MSKNPEVDRFYFEKRYNDFIHHVEDVSGATFKSFNSNAYTEKEEGYKSEVFSKARKVLDYGSWSLEDVGSGKIIQSLIAAIEIPDNNLVTWHSGYGDAGRQHHDLYRALQNPKALVGFEELLFTLYHDKGPEEGIFRELVTNLGKNYGLIAYIFFLKDKNRYLPIAPRNFDKAFKKLGISFKTERRCSWDNYTNYNSLLAELRWLLISKLGDDVTLLDAHSFAWMLATKVDEFPTTTSQLQEYDKLPPKDKEIVQKTRIGQERFRQKLLDYWGTGAVTDCRNHKLLRASHIKPWSECDVSEALDPYNGLPLIPNLDHAFDRGFISFDDNGRIIVSSALDKEDASLLGVKPDLVLRKIDTKHKIYLQYHREHVLK